MGRPESERALKVLDGDMLAQFFGQRFLNLETYRRDGTPVRTPLLFVVDQGVIYMRTPANTYKVKRLRANSRARLVPSDFKGEPKGKWISGQATVFPAAALPQIQALSRQKYGWLKRLIDLRSQLRRPEFVVLAFYPD